MYVWPAKNTNLSKVLYSPIYCHRIRLSENQWSREALVAFVPVPSAPEAFAPVAQSVSGWQ